MYIYILIIRSRPDYNLSRQPFALPSLTINRKAASVFDYRFEDFEVEAYQPHDAIKADISI